MDVSTRAIYFRLLRQVRPHWRMFALAVLAMTVLAATEPAIPALMKPTLDGSFVEKDLSAVTTMAMLMVLVFLVRGVSAFMSAMSLNWVSGRLVMDLRNRMFDKLVTLPSKFYDHQSSGTLISKVTYDAAQVTEAATMVLMVLVKDTLAIVGLLAWMIYLNWQLTLVALIAAPIIVLLVRYFSSHLRGMSYKVQESMGDLTRVTEEVVHGHQVVRSFGAQPYEGRRFHQAANEARRFLVRFETAAAANSPIAQFITAIALAVILYVAAHQSAAGELTIGSFVSFFTAMAMMFAPLKRLTGVNGRLQRGIAAAVSVFELIDEHSEPDEGTRTIERARGQLTLRRVSFAYEPGGPYALRDVSLDISPGETVALVGPSGAGKSTLASLISRFYELEEGQILLDGVDIRELRLASLRQNIALVSQEIVLFNDTVAANIAYGRMDEYDRADIERAARAAHAMEFIAELAQGLDTQVGERGVRLSGGQRQRLAIARAFLKDSPVLVLDEATSSLDTAAERHIQAALEDLRRGRTTLIIAHRLSTIEQADRIAVLSAGRLVEVGTHATLLERSSLYASLYRFQFARQQDETLAAKAR